MRRAAAGHETSEPGRPAGPLGSERRSITMEVVAFIAFFALVVAWLAAPSEGPTRGLAAAPAD